VLKPGAIELTVNTESQSWQRPQKHCVRCGCVLEAPLDQLLGVCGKPYCRGAHFAEKRQREEAAERKLRQEIAARVLKQLKESSQTENSGMELPELTAHGLSMVPSCDAGLCQLPADRIERFAQHLDGIIARAIELLRDPEAVDSLLVEYSHRDFRSVEAPILPVLNGCATCRGYCCRAGGDTALLSPQLIAWQLLSDPTDTGESIRQNYLKRLPVTSVDDSCVYHTANGCALGRQERANICNDFHCWELQGVLEIYQPEDPRTWVAVAVSGDQPRRIGISKPGSPRVEPPLP
jgi:hypothetical protein